VETEDAIDRIYVEVACSWRPPLQAIVGEATASSITVPKSPMTLLSVGAVELGVGGVRPSPAISVAVERGSRDGSGGDEGTAAMAPGGGGVGEAGMMGHEWIRREERRRAAVGKTR
jgi:hypothetical protein